MSNSYKKDTNKICREIKKTTEILNEKSNTERINFHSKLQEIINNTLKEIEASYTAEKPESSVTENYRDPEGMS